MVSSDREVDTPMPAFPDEPPDDADSLRAWARALAEAAPGTRSEALGDLPSWEGDPWVDALTRLFPEAADRPRQGRVAWDLWSRLEEAGLPSHRIGPLLGELVALAPVREAWTDWEWVADRQEVQARTRILAHAPTLAPEQADFLLFALRASDPAVYHPAAVAVGRHALASSRIREALRTYAGERGLDVREPVTLDGDRTRRRLLLVQAGARSAHRDPDPRQDLLDLPPPLPADLPSDPTDPLPSDPADVVALVRAVTTMVEAGEDDEALRAGADALVAAVPRLPDRTLSRWVVQAWSELLVALPDPHVGREPGVRLLERIVAVPDPETGALAEPLAGLLQLDAGLRVLPRLPGDLAGDLLDHARESAPPPLRPALLSRAIAWAARARGPDPAWVDDAMDRLAHAGPSPFLDASSVELRSPGGRGIQVLEVLAADLREGPSWPGRSPRQRALRALLALDAVRHGTPPPDRVRSLLSDIGLLPEAADPGDSLLGLLLEGLLSLEPDGADAFLDARFLHEAASSRLLLAVLGPEARVPPEDLADALEHLLRVQLRGDPAFEPLAFLVRTSIRRPDPAVYEALADVSQGRTYHRPHDGAFPLSGVAGLLALDAAEARGPTDPWDDAPAAGGPPSLVAARERLRDRLSPLRDPGPPDEAVQALVDAVGGGPPGATSPADTARGLLRAIHPREGALLAAGRPAWRPVSRSALENTLGDALRRIEDRIPDLRPEALQVLDQGADPAADIADAIADVRDLAVPHLPGPEADLLEAALGALEERLARWSRGVDELREAWQAGSGVAGADDLLDAVTAGWSPPDRRPILSTALRSLADPRAGADPDALLSWAATREGPGTWTADERSTWWTWRRGLWRTCLERALSGERPARVRELLADDAYERERSHPASGPLLDRARTWGYERYRLGPALAAERGRPGGSRGLPSLRAVKGYLGHFSPVWLALVVGAILMLDFGDAWREMAAAGDVQGVAVTAVLGVAGAFGYVLADLGTRTRPDAADVGRGFGRPGFGAGDDPDPVEGMDPRRRSPGPSGSPAGADPGGPPGSPGAPGIGPGWAPYAEAGGGRPSALALDPGSVARAGGFVALCLAWALAVTAGLWWLLSGTDEVVHGPGAPLHVAVWSGFALFVGIFFGLVAKEA